MLREAAAAVVIGAGTPERRSRGTPEPLLTVLAQGDRPLLRDGEQQLKAAAFYADVSIAADHGQGQSAALIPGGAQGGGSHRGNGLGHIPDAEGNDTAVRMALSLLLGRGGDLGEKVIGLGEQGGVQR